MEQYKCLIVISICGRKDLPKGTVKTHDEWQKYLKYTKIPFPSRWFELVNNEQ